MRARVLTGLVLALSGVASTALAAPLSVTSSDLTVFRTCTLTPTGSSSVAGVDAHIDQNSPGTNSGTATTMSVRSQSNRNRRIYLSFDLDACDPAIGASAGVMSATVRLFVTSLPGACRTHDIFRVTSSWTETGVTWSNQPFGTSVNNPPTASRTSAIGIGSSACQNVTNNAYVSGWDVTADVAAFVTGTANHGWMIRDDAESTSPPRTAVYVARETNDASRSPQLVVDYRP